MKAIRYWEDEKADRYEEGEEDAAGKFPDIGEGLKEIEIIDLISDEEDDEEVPYGTISLNIPDNTAQVQCEKGKNEVDDDLVVQEEGEADGAGEHWSVFKSWREMFEMSRHKVGGRGMKIWIDQVGDPEIEIHKVTLGTG